MGQTSTTWHSHRRATHPWPRASRRRWVRPNDLIGMTSLFTAIPWLPRAELARLAERMINRMDQIDGDPDLEDLREDDEDTHDREQEEAHD